MSSPRVSDMSPREIAKWYVRTYRDYCRTGWRTWRISEAVILYRAVLAQVE